MRIVDSDDRQPPPGRTLGEVWIQAFTDFVKVFVAITLPLIRTLARCTAEEKESIRGIVERKQATEEDVRAVFGLIGNYDGIRYALERARTIIAEGKAALEPFQDGEAKASLLAMADFIAERTR